MTIHRLGDYIEGLDLLDTAGRRETFVKIARKNSLKDVQWALDGALVIQREVGRFPVSASLVADSNLRSVLRQAGVQITFDLPDGFKGSSAT